MSATVTWIGMAEFRAALRGLPAELAELGRAIVSEAAERTKAEIQAAYPIGPGDDEYEGGNLRKGVRVQTLRRSPFAAGAVVRSSAPHAYLFEVGTQTRQTKLGYNRGFMPGANIFVPIAQRNRREMEEDLVAVIEQAGLSVRR